MNWVAPPGDISERTLSLSQPELRPRSFFCPPRSMRPTHNPRAVHSLNVATPDGFKELDTHPPQSPLAPGATNPAGYQALLDLAGNWLCRKPCK